MSHLPFTLFAYFFNSISITVDKFLLTKHVPNPVVYIFYISIFSLVALLFLPFTSLPSLNIFLLASSSTLLWTTGAYFMYAALQKGQSSRVIPVIGTLVPVTLLTIAFFQNSLSLNEIWAGVILVLGLIFITLNAWGGKIFLKELLFEVLSALFFASSYLVLREAYLQENFLTVLVYSRLILLPIGLFILLIPNFRKTIFLKKDGPKINFFSKIGLLFLIGQILGGSQELLLTFSISLANPAIVNSLQGTQYVFLLIFNIALSKKYPHIFQEDLSPKALTTKILGIILIGLGLVMLAYSQIPTNQKITLGLTYSPRYAEELKLDPKKTYSQMLEDLKIDTLRFPVYWDDVEATKGHYDFSETDFYLDEAQKRNLKVVLVVGLKQPRWPECFVPNWARRLTPPERADRVLKLVQKEVEHFKNYPNIVAWQVENEPFLWFGQCDSPKERERILPEEIEIVKSVDPRPILVTDSGELTTWRKALPQAEWFGTTLYRSVWNPIFGSVEYPIPPFFYSFKGFIVKTLTQSPVQKFVIAELQAEPWATARSHITEVPLEEQIKLFPPQKLKKNVSYAKDTKFSEIYLWGVEWWYWMGKNGHPEYIQAAQEIFNKN
jgi:drug/metabolite transporter (DMT)-like permease